MGHLEQAKKLLAEYKEKQAELIRDIKDEYDSDDYYEDDDELLDAISDGSIALSWRDGRELEYIDNMVYCQEMLVRALEMLSQKEANKTLETLVHKARQIIKFRTSDIGYAQNVINTMNDIIKVCNELRK